MSKLFRKIEEKSVIEKRRIIKCLPNQPEEGIILYLDEDNIEKIYNKAIAINKFKAEEHDLYEKINELNHLTNLNHMALELSKAIKITFSVDEFVDRSKVINNKSVDIYPGMPIKILGNVNRFLNKDTLQIQYKEKEINIRLKKENNLRLNKDFIYGRLVFVLGEVALSNKGAELSISTILC